MTIGCDPERDNSFKQTDAPGLRFDSHNDALDFSAHCIKGSSRWHATHALDLAEHYANLNIELVVNCLSTRDGE